MLGTHHIIVKFGSGISGDEQGRAMLHMEKFLRERGVPAEVFKETKADDVRSRATLTIEERNNL